MPFTLFYLSRHRHRCLYFQYFGQLKEKKKKLFARLVEMDTVRRYPDPLFYADLTGSRSFAVVNNVTYLSVFSIYDHNIHLQFTVPSNSP
jgi:hypothetical protein